ncbi:lipopolysaccharide export system protein LptA [Desulfuromusa kysingii]|uniref:Lipopolysaccharide export system protein LptA n=1 Tax=Desulfuromusa kysingii TaxID=37625 RepID=A0A1H3ZQ19_9BACT|nr:lipopolysaccharide transport periplasmic protein LptA [Desulfuromusa kysingii]SEA25352.1 lipopolysaccharide export system protein LptA [Desulfuromusa kysingii]
MMFRWLLLTLLTIALCDIPLTFAVEAGSEIDRSQPIVITSRQLEVLQQQRQSIFTGEVVAKQGEMTLYAEKLIVVFQQDQDQVERLDAIGGVRVLQLDRVATAEKATFHQMEETLVLVGDAEVTQGNNKVAGDEITVYLKDNRTVIKSLEKSRVKATIIPEKGQE